ncbi:MAG TPA: hypothetical protein VNH11_14240 [Pirellulales bacterium]|nr:hypothetical protein [Pirellulales bacterium]
MATVQQLASERRFILHGVPWDTYVALGDIEANGHVRMTYDRGTLEMMGPRAVRFTTVLKLLLATSPRQKHSWNTFRLGTNRPAEQNG